MERTKVCVTGGSGYLGSWLVKKLLERGYVVHATLRRLGLLKTLPNADTGLVLFKVDIYNPNEFDLQLKVATMFSMWLAIPMQHNPQSSQYKDAVEDAVGRVKTIADSFLRSQTVKRLTYSASVVETSPLKDDGTGFKYYWDE